MESRDSVRKVGEPCYEVVSPLGEVTKRVASVAPQLDTLNGKTVCELSVGMYNFQTSFPIIREALQKRFFNIKVIPYSEFPEILMMTQGKEYQEYMENLLALLKQRGCDGVIIGNGG